MIQYNFANKLVFFRVNHVTLGQSQIFKFGSSPGILIRTVQGEPKAFTAVCIHLACTVRYEAETETILCPCHDGRFDLAGNVLSGPPPAPLEEYHVEISGDVIFVSRKA
ncbi:MAG: ubiquinol-cytochrome c reductase iron-sulfur subunit [Candidatus Aminicenantales bacterium]